MSSSSAERNPVEALAEEFAEEFAERHRKGERPSLTEYVTKYPHLAEEIRDLFPALVMMENLKPATGDVTGGYDSEIVRDNRKLERLGDYRILRQVGRGGMGVVYEAEQISLGRHVALKVLTTNALLDAKQVQRFQREAKAAARLHHTNIVPVYGVGETDGVHYYVMQFIQGQALDQVLRELQRLRGKDPGTTWSHNAPVIAEALFTGRGSALANVEAPAEPQSTAMSDGQSLAKLRLSDSSSIKLPGQSSPSTMSSSGQEFFRSVARVGVQVADALAYASSQGTLHRDIKPSNLILDTQATVWITDFGLAKAADSVDLTHPGDFVGTLRYMAPERFQGHADIRSDVYALGLTLYELATLQPAFTASDKHKLMQQVMHEEPPRPRKLTPEVPRDLETIILKSIARDPEQRYQTATKMAEDLRRYLEDRPIQARRASNLERLWRWGRRNPIVAGLLVSVLVLLTIVASGGIVMSLRLSTALKQAELDRDKALEEETKRKAEEARSTSVWQSLVDKAADEVRSGRVGQRIKTLDWIKQAAGIAATPKLRSLATTALTLCDFELVSEWDGWPIGTQCLTFDARQQMFVRGDHACNFEICRVVTNGEEVLRRLQGAKGDRLNSQVLSPDGRYLGVLLQRSAEAGGRYEFCVRDLEAADDRWLIQDAEIGTNAMGTGFHPKSTEVAVVYQDHTLRRYSLHNGKLLSRRTFQGDMHHPCYDPTGERIAVGAGNRIFIYETKTDRLLATLEVPGFTWCITWRPDGQVLFATVGSKIHVFDPLTGKSVMQPWETGVTGFFTYSKHGDRIVNQHGSVWDANGRGQVTVLFGHFLVSSLITPKAPERWPTQNGSKIRLWRLHAGDEVRTLTRRWTLPNETMSTSALEPRGRLLATQSHPHGNLALFDLASGEQVADVSTLDRNLKISNDRVSDRGWFLNNNGKLLDWPVHWPMRDGAPVTIGPAQESNDRTELRQLKAGVTRDGRMSAFVSGTSTKLIESTTERLVAEIVHPGRERYDPLYFTSDGSKLISVSSDRTKLQVLDLRKIRSQLKALNPKLDWDWPEFPPDTTPQGPIRVEVVGADATGTKETLARPLPKLAWPSVTDFLSPWWKGSKAAAADILTRGQRFSQMEWFDFALRDFEEAVRRDPNHIPARLARGLERFRRTRWPDAVADLTFLVAARPDFEPYWFRRAWAYYELGRLPEAVEDLKTIVQNTGRPIQDRAAFLVLRSEWNDRLGRKVDAAADRLAADLLVNKSVRGRAANKIAWIVVTNSPEWRMPAAGVALARQAVEADPNSATYLNTLGVAQYRTGAFADAVVTLNKSLTQGAGRADAHDLYFLAMCHAKLGQADHAKDCFDRAERWTQKNQSQTATVAAEIRSFRAEAKTVLRAMPAGKE